MSSKVHRIVKDSDDLDDVLVFAPSNAEYEEMPTSPMPPCNPQRKYTRGDIFPGPNSYRGGA